MSAPRDARSHPAVTRPGAGSRIVPITVAITVAFAATALLGVVSASARGLAAAVALVMFVGGAAGMLTAVVLAAGRSRTHAIGVGGLFFLAPGVAPAAVRRILLGCWAAQVVFGVGGALARPYTSMAFGVLTPVAGLAACGLWSARYGEFGPRT